MCQSRTEAGVLCKDSGMLQSHVSTVALNGQANSECCLLCSLSTVGQGVPLHMQA